MLPSPKFRFLKMGDRQVTIGFNTKMIVIFLDDNWGYPHDLGRLQIMINPHLLLIIHK